MAIEANGRRGFEKLIRQAAAIRIGDTVASVHRMIGILKRSDVAPAAAVLFDDATSATGSQAAIRAATNERLLLPSSVSKPYFPLTLPVSAIEAPLELGRNQTVRFWCARHCECRHEPLNPFLHRGGCRCISASRQSDVQAVASMSSLLLDRSHRPGPPSTT